MDNDKDGAREALAELAMRGARVEGDELIVDDGSRYRIEWSLDDRTLTVFANGQPILVHEVARSLVTASPVGVWLELQLRSLGRDLDVLRWRQNATWVPWRAVTENER